METEEQSLELTEIYLEKQADGNFDDKLEQLRIGERQRELGGFVEANRLRDQYKAKIAERAIREEKDSSEIKEMPVDLREELDEKLRAIDDKNAANGVYFLKCHFSKIIDDLRRGKRVEFDAFSPYLVNYIHQDMDSGEVDFVKADAIGLAIMEFLRKEMIPEAHPVSLYDEYNFHDKKGRIEVESEIVKRKFKEFVEKTLRAKGIIKEGEVAGPDKDYVLISESEKIKDAETLVKTLKGKGLIEYGNGEEIWFQNTIEKCEDPRHLRINLRNKNGKWQCAALDAASFLDERNRSITHLVILSKGDYEKQQDQVWEILRSLGFQPENYHNIFFDAENQNVTPESVVRTLRSQIEVLLPRQESIGREYTEWDKFDPLEYALRNYGNMGAEDRQIIEAVFAQLKIMGLKEGELNDAADIVAGPCFIPAMIWSNYVKDGGKIKLIEYSSANRNYLEKILAEEPEAEYREHKQNWQNYSKEIEGINPDQGNYFEKTQGKIEVEAGSIYDLPAEKFSAVSSFFCTESITDNHEEFQIALNSLIKSLKPGGIFIITHMLESQGYKTGEGTNFPAVSLTVKDLEKAYASTDCKLKDVCIKRVVAENEEDKPRHGYDGMAVVIGRKEG